MATPVAELGRLFGFPERPNLAPRWNIAPTQAIAAVRAPSPDGVEEPGAHLSLMRWGLVPFWAKDTTMAAKMINARGETVPEKPAFREAFRHRRCVIPADGFYEWRSEGGKKLPVYFRRRDGSPILFAGLWERWSGPKDAPLTQPLLTACIVTTSANAVLAALHDRMPVILDLADWPRWIDPATAAEAARGLMRPAADSVLEAIPVAPLVNAVRNEGADLIRPLADEPRLL